MTRLAVKTFVAEQLANLDQPVQVAVFTQRPKQVAIGEQIAVVVSDPTVQKKRLTMGRPSASKTANHTIRLDVYWIGSDDQDSGTQFDVLLDKIDFQFEQIVTLPVAITDPETGDGSTITFLGEEIKTEVQEPLQVTDQEGDEVEGELLFAATKDLTVQEVYQG